MDNKELEKKYLEIFNDIYKGEYGKKIRQQEKIGFIDILRENGMNELADLVQKKKDYYEEHGYGDISYPTMDNTNVVFHSKSDVLFKPTIDPECKGCVKAQQNNIDSLKNILEASQKLAEEISVSLDMKPSKGDLYSYMAISVWLNKHGIASIENMEDSYNKSKDLYNYYISAGPTESILQFLNYILSITRDYKEPTKIDPLVNSLIEAFTAKYNTDKELTDKIDEISNILIKSNFNGSSMHQIGAWFVRKHYNKYGSLLTRSKLNFLLYYVYSWYLFFENDLEDTYYKKIFDGHFIATPNGPTDKRVKVYHAMLEKALTDDKIEVVNDIYTNDVLSISDKVNKILDDVWNEYGAMSGEELSSISLQELPTQRARAGLSYNETCTNVIKDIDIFDEYLKRQGVDK